MILLAADFQNSGSQRAWDQLRSGANAIDALETGVKAVELNYADMSVGRGGIPNALGEVELDAGVMDGRTRASGAVAGLKGYLHPVSVAHAVMRRLPHVLLVGEGAATFAEATGAERGELLTPETRQKWAEWCAERGVDLKDPLPTLINAVSVRRMTREAGYITDLLPEGEAIQKKDDESHDGTTIYLGMDTNGDIAAVTSTSGWAYKFPGRVGDTPIAGAGFYADNRYGAAGCTGTGEIAIRTSLARITVIYLKQGMRAREAVLEALKDAQEVHTPQTNITLYAIDTHGGHFAAFIPNENQPRAPYYYAAVGDMAETVRYPAHHFGRVEAPH